MTSIENDYEAVYREIAERLRPSPNWVIIERARLLWLARSQVIAVVLAGIGSGASLGFFKTGNPIAGVAFMSFAVAALLVFAVLLLLKRRP